MNISNECPPIYHVLHEKLGVEWDDGILITVGDTLYTKDSRVLRDDLIVHEKCHEVQQRKEGSAFWWNKYLNDVKFRLEEEIAAYQCQAEWIKQNVKDRNAKYKFYHSMATDLSSSMYGNLISYTDAMRRIRL